MRMYVYPYMRIYVFMYIHIYIDTSIKPVRHLSCQQQQQLPTECFKRLSLEWVTGPWVGTHVAAMTDMWSLAFS